LLAHIDELIHSTPKITAVRAGSYLPQNVDAERCLDKRTLRQYVAAPRRAQVQVSTNPLQVVRLERL